MPPAIRKKRKATADSATCCPTPNLRARPLVPYARFFRALADSTRLEVVGLLAEQGKELCVCEIESHFKLSQPTVSHHLRLLRQAGIVDSERRGTWVYYWLRPEAREKLRRFGDLLQS